MSTVDVGATPPPDRPTNPDVGGRGELLDVISIHHWLAEQGFTDTPTRANDWLHAQIVAIADGPRLRRAARLADVDEFRQLFADRLDAAFAVARGAHDLGADELIGRYTTDDEFRANLQAVAGVAAYLAVRADPALPPDEYRAAATVGPRRLQILIKAVEDHAARYAHVGHAARYVAEAHVPGGASRTEWDWIAYYIAAHPDVLQRMPLPLADLARQDREVAEALDRQAAEAFAAGDYPRARELVDRAELHQPGRDWQSVRDYIDEHANASTHVADPASEATDPRPTAATAFPNRSADEVRGGESPPAVVSQEAAAPAHARRSSHR